MSELSREQGDYAAWWVTSKREREASGLPTSDQEYAEKHGVATRTLRRWRLKPEFEAYCSELKAAARPAAQVAALSAPRAALPEPEFDDNLSPDELMYASVKSEIARQAAGGDPRATEMYLKYWGQDHLRREREENERLAGMDDTQLVREVIQLLGTETVAGILLDM